jgi:hypothetical protein
MPQYYLPYVEGDCSKSRQQIALSVLQLVASSVKKVILEIGMDECAAVESSSERGTCQLKFENNQIEGGQSVNPT